MRYGAIIAGGGGTRLWPASRSGRPKQFLPLGPNNASLLRATVDRTALVCSRSRTFVVTTTALSSPVAHELPDVAADHILCEPVERNTAAAVALAAALIAPLDPDAVIAALPADHHIADALTFATDLDVAFRVAEVCDRIVTLGIKPTRPDTGFGYIRCGKDLGLNAYAVDQFIEKPNDSRAQQLASSPNHLWNSGIYVVSVARLFRELALHMPDTHRAAVTIRDAMATLGRTAALEIAEQLYPSLPATSFDRGIAEPAAAIAVIPARFAWNDVGSWDGVAEITPSDNCDNRSRGSAVFHRSRRCLTVSDDNAVIAVIGCSDLIVVQNGRNVLVVPRGQSQDVRDAVAILRSCGLDDCL